MPEIMPQPATSVAANPITHPAWCDPRMCGVGDPGSGLGHTAFGEPIPMSLYDRWVDVDGRRHLPEIDVWASQYDDEAPTISLNTDAGGMTPGREHTAAEIHLTRDEATALRDDLTRWIEATA